MILKFIVGVVVGAVVTRIVETFTDEGHWLRYLGPLPAIVVMSLILMLCR